MLHFNVDVRPRGGERAYFTTACASAVSVYCWKSNIFPSGKVHQRASSKVRSTIALTCSHSCQLSIKHEAIRARMKPRSPHNSVAAMSCQSLADLRLKVGAASVPKPDLGNGLRYEW